MKLFVFDVDGTLLKDFSLDMSKDTIDSLNDILKHGNAIAIASGRPYVGIKKFLDKLVDGHKFCICANGTEVTDMNGNTLYINSFTAQEYYDFIDRHNKLLEHPDTNIYIYSHRHIAYFKGGFWIDMESKCNDNLPKFDLNKHRFAPDHNILKIMIASNENESSRIEKEEITDYEKEHFSIVRSAKYFIEFIKKGADKSAGVSFLKQYLNIENNDDVYTFGDGGNDILMVKNFNGIAMGNAIKEVKENAKFITKDCSEDGVSYAIRNYCKL
ncbi:MAG: Cof-type HAD-IIB family hydrolase [Bacilli bacterium]